MTKSNFSENEYQSQLAISVFMVIFSLTIFAAVFFSETPEGKVVNFLSGLILLLIGGLFGFLGWRRMKDFK